MAPPSFINLFSNLFSSSHSRPILAVLLALLPAWSHAQTAAQTAAAPPAPDFGGNILQLLLSLGAVLAMIVGALWLLKKITQQRGTTSGLLRVVAGTAVGARERVVIVEVGSTWLVLGVAPGRISALAEVPRQVAPAGERRPASAVPGDAIDLTAGTSTAPHNFSARQSAALPDWLRNLTRRGGNPPS